MLVIMLRRVHVKLNSGPPSSGNSLGDHQANWRKWDAAGTAVNSFTTNRLWLGTGQYLNSKIGINASRVRDGVPVQRES